MGTFKYKLIQIEHVFSIFCQYGTDLGRLEATPGLSQYFNCIQSEQREVNPVHLLLLRCSLSSLVRLWFIYQYCKQILASSFLISYFTVVSLETMKYCKIIFFFHKDLFLGEMLLSNHPNLSFLEERLAIQETLGNVHINKD